MNEEQQKIWNQFREFYKQKFNIEPQLVEIMANLDILKLCAAGSSNTAISNFLDIDVDTIQSVVDAYLGFGGWQEDLPINPMLIYKNLPAKEFNNFVEALLTVDSLGATITTMEHMFDSCIIMDGLERLLDEKWT